jgi:PEP-CTERM motif
MKVMIRHRISSLAPYIERLVGNRHPRGRVLRYLIMLVLCGGSLFAAGANNTAKANAIGVGPASSGITASNLGLTFYSNQNSLVVSGSAPDSIFQFSNSNSSASALSNASLTLNASLTRDAVFSGGTFSLLGNGGTLLTGTLTSFEFSSTGIGQGTFLFTFVTTAADPSLGFGTNGTLVISSFDLAPGPLSELNFFGTACARITSGTPTTSPVPEPTSIILLGLGGLGLIGKLRRRKRE